jgi:hypothetical protein
MTYANAPQSTGPGHRVSTQSNGMAIAGLVCGIVGLILLAMVLGPLAIIFGSIGRSRARRGAEHGTMATWAIGLGILDIVLWVVLLAIASGNGMLG